MAQLYLLVTARTSFSLFVDTTNILKDAAVWIFVLFAIIIDGTNEPFDLSIIFIASLCILVVTTTIYYMKRDRFKNILNNFASVRNE
jgi:hypothetical protein